MMVRDDRQLEQVIAGSRFVGAGARVLTIVGDAAASSFAVGLTKRAGHFWRTSTAQSRRFAGGGVLLTAAMVHTVLLLAQGLPAGWLWALLPGIAIALAGVLLGLANANESGQEKGR